MMEIRDTRPWFWILIAALSAVAIVALVIAISANNNSVDEKKITNDATAQIKQELAGLNGALKAADEFQTENQKFQNQTNREAAQDRKRIKREVNAAVIGGEAQLGKLKKRVKKIEGEIADLETEDANLEQQAKENQEELVQDLNQTNRRITKLEG